MPLLVVSSLLPAPAQPVPSGTAKARSRSTRCGVAWVLAALAGAGCSVNYFDPCQRLAYRICSCEETQSQRQACEQDRIQNPSNDPRTPEQLAEQNAVCADALSTCTCEALDQNRTDLCGFTRDGSLSADDDGDDAQGGLLGVGGGS